MSDDERACDTCGTDVDEYPKGFRDLKSCRRCGQLRCYNCVMGDVPCCGIDEEEE